MDPRDTACMRNRTHTSRQSSLFPQCLHLALMNRNYELAEFSYKYCVRSQTRVQANGKQTRPTGLVLQGR